MAAFVALGKQKKSKIYFHRKAAEYAKKTVNEVSDRSETNFTLLISL
jgi:hypothetical protein